MNSQTPKMRLIAMFYLTVFASALLVAGWLNSRQALPDSAGKAPALVYASTDSVPSASVNPSLEPGESGPEVPKNNKPDGSPLSFSFNFTSILQWILGLSAKSISLNAKPVLQPASQNIWLSVHNLRI